MSTMLYKSSTELAFGTLCLVRSSRAKVIFQEALGVGKSGIVKGRSENINGPIAATFHPFDDP